MNLCQVQVTTGILYHFDLFGQPHITGSVVWPWFWSMSHITLTLVACEKWFKKTALRNFWSWFKNLFTSTLDTTIISKMSNTHWHPGKRCCIPLHKKNLSKFWLIILFVTSHNASGPNVEMRPLCHKSHPWLNRLKWYSNINHDVTTSDVQAWARSPKPAQAGLGKPSQAWAVLMALRGPRLRLQYFQAWAVGLSRGLDTISVVLAYHGSYSKKKITNILY